MSYHCKRKGWEEFGIARENSQNPKDDMQHFSIADKETYHVDPTDSASKA